MLSPLWRCVDAATVFLLRGSTILIPAVDNPIHILGCLRATHIAVLHNRVIIIAWRLQSEHELPYIAPSLMIPALFLCQSHSITNMVIATVIAGKSEFYPFATNRHIAELTL